MSNLEILRQAYERYGRRDFALVDELFAEDIDWRVAEREPMRGRPAVRQFFEELAAAFASHEIDVEDAVESGDRVVCFVRHAFTRADGAVGVVEAAHDWRLQGGQLVSLREIADSLALARIAGLLPELAAA